MEQVSIFLTPIDVEAFKLFQKHYVAFKMLDSVGAFNIKNGSITLDFNHLGEIKGIKKQELFKPQ
jgi:hypothetical protein